MDTDGFLPFIGISRHRLATDGEGVTTLAAFHGCPLACRYCLNPQCRGDEYGCMWYSPETLYEEVKIDGLYFTATGGGITFGGGEPLLHAGFIRRFRDICGTGWSIYVETSLNVDKGLVEELLPVVDGWIVDVKDIDADVYLRYTGADNRHVVENLTLLARGGKARACLVRLPLIPGYNTVDGVARSEERLRRMGFSRFDKFGYIVKADE